MYAYINGGATTTSPIQFTHSLTHSLRPDRTAIFTVCELRMVTPMVQSYRTDEF